MQRYTQHTVTREKNVCGIEKFAAVFTATNCDSEREMVSAIH